MIWHGGKREYGRPLCCVLLEYNGPTTHVPTRDMSRREIVSVVDPFPAPPDSRMKAGNLSLTVTRAYGAGQSRAIFRLKIKYSLPTVLVRRGGFLLLSGLIACPQAGGLSPDSAGASTAVADQAGPAAAAMTARSSSAPATSAHRTPVVAATWLFGRIATEAAAPVLEAGGSALDAVNLLYHCIRVHSPSRRLVSPIK